MVDPGARRRPRRVDARGRAPAVESELLGMDRAASRFRPDSEVSQLAESGGRLPASLPCSRPRPGRLGRGGGDRRRGRPDPGQVPGRRRLRRGLRRGRQPDPAHPRARPDPGDGVVAGRPPRRRPDHRPGRGAAGPWRHREGARGRPGRRTRIDAAHGPVLSLSAATCGRPDPARRALAVELAERPTTRNRLGARGGRRGRPLHDDGTAVAQRRHWAHHVLDPARVAPRRFTGGTATVAAATCVDAERREHGGARQGRGGRAVAARERAPGAAGPPRRRRSGARRLADEDAA